MRLSDEVRAVVDRDGVIARRDHRVLTGAMARMVRDGKLAAGRGVGSSGPAGVGQMTVG